MSNKKGNNLVFFPFSEVWYISFFFITRFVNFLLFHKKVFDFFFFILLSNTTVNRLNERTKGSCQNKIKQEIVWYLTKHPQPNPFMKKQEINKSCYKKAGNVPNLTKGGGGGIPHFGKIPNYFLFYLTVSLIRENFNKKRK